MRVLVSGAGGQVGRALCAQVPAGVELLGYTHAQLDVTDAQQVGEVIARHAPQVIVNAAAHTAVDRAESEPELARRVNSDGPRHLALAARAVGARLLHLSTDYVFDGARALPYEPAAATNPLNVYGRSKRDGEQAVLEALPQRALVLRTSWVYAAHGANFLNTMLRLMAAAQPLRVVADQIGTPTAAHSVAQALWALIAHPQLHGVHHWRDAGIASWYDFAVAIGELAQQAGLLSQAVSVTPISSAEYPSAARRPPYSVLDTRSLALLGLPATHWRVQLRSVLRERARG